MIVSPSRTIKVLFEDETFIIFEKPSGLLVIPAPNKHKKTMVEVVNAEFAFKTEANLYPCHRLDQGTSGIIVFAKGKRHQKLMRELFNHNNIEKRYVAFVRGKLSIPQAQLKNEVKDFFGKKFAPKAHGRFAETRFVRLAYNDQFTLVEVHPKTGRTNQIRIQFSQMGHPLLGERIYAFRKDFSLNFKRLALHAGGLIFRHPISRKRLDIHSPLPEDMRAFLKEHLGLKEKDLKKL